VGASKIVAFFPSNLFVWKTNRCLDIFWLCSLFCRCSEEYVSFDFPPEMPLEEKMSIYVDDTKVTNVRKLGRCYFLHSSENDGIWTSQKIKPGQYSISIRIKRGKYAHGIYAGIQSFVILEYVSDK